MGPTLNAGLHERGRSHDRTRTTRRRETRPTSTNAKRVAADD